MADQPDVYDLVKQAQQVHLTPPPDAAPSLPVPPIPPAVPPPVPPTAPIGGPPPVDPNALLPGDPRATAIDPIQIAQQAQRDFLLQGVDTRTGAPIGTRIAVGAESDDASRLAALRKLQANAGITPDAEPLPGTSNFIYTDPGTGRRTLYRAGFGLGDIASIAPEAVGGLLGGTVGALAAAPSAAVSGPVGPVAGFGLGAAGGEEATRLAIEGIAGTSGSQTLPASLLHLATSAGVNAIAPEAGKFLLAPFARSMTVTDPTGQVPSMLMGDLLGSKTAQGVDKALYNLPGGSAVVSNQARQATGETGQVASKIAGDLTNATRVAAGQPPTMPTAPPEALGGLLNDAATRAAQSYEARVGQLTDAVETAVGPNTPTSVDGLRALQADLKAQAAKGGDPAAIQPALDRVDGIIATADKQGGTLPWSVVRSYRTNINKEVDDSSPGKLPGTGSAEYAQIPDALSDDLQNGANNAGPDAQEAWRRYNAVISNYRQAGGAGDAVTQFAKPGTSDDPIASRFLTATKGDAQSLAYLRGQVSPQDWDQITGSYFSRLGLAKPGAQDTTGQVFSPATFLTNWNAMSDAAKNVLFQGTRYDGVRDDVDQLAQLAQAQKSGTEFANPAGTARQIGWLTVANAISDALTGGFSEAGKVLTGTLAVPYSAAKVMTSRPALQWMRNMAASPAGAWNANIARLGSVAAADPSMTDIVAQLQRNMPQQAPSQ